LTINTIDRFDLTVKVLAVNMQWSETQWNTAVDGGSSCYFENAINLALNDLDFNLVLLKIVTMKKKSLRIYKSLFNLNLDSLKTLIQDESDLYLSFPIPDDFDYSDSFVKLTAFDIIRMKIDIWVRVTHSKDLKEISDFLPENIYKKAIECKEYLESKFPDFNSNFEYVKYQDLMLDFYSNENYIDEESFKDYLIQGFQSIDIELVNAAISRNEKLVIDLLKNGAKPTINLASNIAIIDLMDYLINEEATCFMDYNILLMGDFNKNDYDDIFYSLVDLYTAASTSKMLLLIDIYNLS